MNLLTTQTILNTISFSTLPGLGGGLVLFLFAYSKNQYKNNKFVQKLLIELIGASITATFVTLAISHPIYQATLAFCVGIGWARLIHLIRNKITKIIEAILGVTFNGGNK